MISNLPAAASGYYPLPNSIDVHLELCQTWNAFNQVGALSSEAATWCRVVTCWTACCSIGPFRAAAHQIIRAIRAVPGPCRRGTRLQYGRGSRRCGRSGLGMPP
eukprot:768520-Hanusia_phi.AAC.2